jgi:two-component system chemotaxis response regulator CheY
MAYGGEIDANRNPGEAVTFPEMRTFVPRSSSAAERGDTMTTPVADILLAENDQDLRDAMTGMLRKAGYSVEAVANGQEALEWLDSAAHPPKLLLLDLIMPVMDGWQFLDEQQKTPRNAAIPVVVLSANGSFAGRSESIPFLRKPVALKPLLAVVGRYCESHLTPEPHLASE